MTKIINNIPPTIVELPTGRWAVSGSTWIPISKTMTLDEVRSWWTKPVIPKPRPTDVFTVNDTIEHIVFGSKGNRYSVKYNAGKWTCTCKAFEFGGRHNTCKHIKNIQKGNI